MAICTPSPSRDPPVLPNLASSGLATPPTRCGRIEGRTTGGPRPLTPLKRTIQSARRIAYLPRTGVPPWTPCCTS
eukprot:14575869-Alexandrium_andersonii.AAC.1